MTLGELLPSLRTSLRPRLDSGIWPATARWGTHGDLLIGGVRMTALAATYGTPLHVLAEPDVRARCAEYVAAFGADAVAYSAKAGLTVGEGRWIAELGLGCYVGSAGELRTALLAGFRPAHLRVSRAPVRPATVVGGPEEARRALVPAKDLPDDISAGDLLAVAGTGAYHHRADRSSGGRPSSASATAWYARSCGARPSKTCCCVRADSPRSVADRAARFGQPYLVQPDLAQPDLAQHHVRLRVLCAAEQP